MGTNYYGTRIPTAEERKELSGLALNGEFGRLSYRLESFELVHIGKSSGGWQFLFNLNGRRFYNTKAELIEWLKGLQIIDEYGRDVTFDELWQVVTNRGPNATKHSETEYFHLYIEIDGLEFSDCEFS